MAAETYISVIVKSTAPKPHAFTLAHTAILWNDWLLCYYSMPDLAIIDCPFPTLPKHQLVLQPEFFPECFIIQEVALINVSVQRFSSRVLSLSKSRVCFEHRIIQIPSPRFWRHLNLLQLSSITLHKFYIWCACCI